MGSNKTGLIHAAARWVFVDQSAKAISAHDPARCHRLMGYLPTRSPLAQSLVWPRLLVVLNKLAEHVFKVATTEDQRVIDDLAPGCSHPPFGV